MSLDSDSELTPLMKACRRGKYNEVKAVIDAGHASVSARDPLGKTALHHSVEHRFVDIVRLLLEQDSSIIDLQDVNGNTALQLAVIVANIVIIRYLIAEGANIHIKDNEQHTLGHWAAVSEHVELIDVIESRGGELASPDIHGAHPIHYAAQMCAPTQGKDTQKAGLNMLKKLISKRVEVNCQDKDGRTPLIWASSTGSKPACELLMKAGANVSLSDKDELTPLHCAASKGHTPCIDLLINKGKAKVDSVDEAGCTPLFYAITLGVMDSVQALLRMKPNPKHQDNQGRSAAHYAAAANVKHSLECLKLLQKHGSEMWLQNNRGDYPLHTAALAGNNESVQFLLEKTVKDKKKWVDVGNNDQRTCLHIAALTGNLSLCKYLVDKSGASKAVQMTYGKVKLVPYDTAVLRRKDDCAEYLLDDDTKTSPVSKFVKKFREQSADNPRKQSDDDDDDKKKDKGDSSDNEKDNNNKKHDSDDEKKSTKSKGNESDDDKSDGDQFDRNNRRETYVRPSSAKSKKSKNDSDDERHHDSDNDKDKESDKESKKDKDSDRESDRENDNTSEAELKNNSDSDDKNDRRDVHSDGDFYSTPHPTNVIVVGKTPRNDDRAKVELNRKRKEESRRKQEEALRRSEEDRRRDAARRKAEERRRREEALRASRQRALFSGSTTEAETPDRRSPRRHSTGDTRDRSPPGGKKSKKPVPLDKRPPWNMHQPRLIPPPLPRHSYYSPERQDPRRYSDGDDDVSSRAESTGKLRPLEVDERRPYRSLLREEIRIYEQKRVAGFNLQKTRRARMMNEYGKPVEEKKVVRHLADEYNMEAHPKNRKPKEEMDFQNMQDFEYHLRDEILDAYNAEKRLHRLEKKYRTGTNKGPGGSAGNQLPPINGKKRQSTKNRSRSPDSNHKSSSLPPIDNKYSSDGRDSYNYNNNNNNSKNNKHSSGGSTGRAVLTKNGFLLITDEEENGRKRRFKPVKSLRKSAD